MRSEIRSSGTKISAAMNLGLINRTIGTTPQLRQEAEATTQMVKPSKIETHLHSWPIIEADPISLATPSCS